MENDLDLSIHRASLTFDLLPIPRVELGLGLGVSSLDIQPQVEHPGTTTVEATADMVPVR